MSEVLDAIKQICKEKGLSVEAVLGTIEQALAAAYRKDFGLKDQNIRVNFDPTTGKIKAFDVKTVVDYGPEEEEEEVAEKKEVKKDNKKKTSKKEKIEKIKLSNNPAAVEEEKKRFNPKYHLTLEDAKKIKKGAKIDEEIITELEVSAPFGRMAAQTAKQVIIQRLREAERDALLKEYKEKEGRIVSGIIQRREGRNFLIDLGKATAILPIEEQIKEEYYNSGQRIKVFIVSANQTFRGPEIIVSRTHPEIIRELFALEIPEINNKTMEIKAIAREAGARSKVAVISNQENLDPIGACIGQRGARIQTIIAELGGEKVDVVEYSEDQKVFITNALSPAKVLKIEINKKTKVAQVEVKDDQFSLAIGKGGRNVRLASNLTGWKIEIKEDSESKEKEKDKNSKEKEKKEVSKKEDKKEEKKKNKKKEKKE
ncbi:MAG: N utilization substance protein A [Parcubacteria group bacterium Athens1014_10]|nr:MAG: N utilization substance protein A [Parcubacteria group bacterium Athens1014_10]